MRYVVLAAVVLLAGCGSDHSRRDAVNTYFDRVEAAQLPVRRESVAITKALQSFSTSSMTSRQRMSLVRARDVLGRVERRVSAVRPPADARRMHGDIVRLYALETGVAAELVQMATFAPQFSRALEPLAPTHKRLTDDLRTVKGWRPLADAFRTYRESLAGVLAELNTLTPPRTLRASFDGQRAGIRRSIGLCSSIENALARRDPKATAAAIAKLSAVAAEQTAVKAHKAQVAAANAYNERLSAISQLQLKIGKERERLVAEVG